MLKVNKNYDVVVVGGGMSGLCAAISSARNGAKTALIQNRPVLGGNASSEIRMHICGADNHGHRENTRETGILEEILLENKKRNPQNSYSVFDTILWEMARFQDNLELFLNTHITEVLVSEDESKIEELCGYQMTTEKELTFTGKLFVDTTGDALIASLSGADIMTGCEAKSLFMEPHASETANSYTMGNTLLFKTIDMGYPVPFVKPAWANTYTEEDLKHREHGAEGYNYWWIELGGDELDVITDGEVIKDELLKAVYGVWDHIKNGGDHQADSYVLDWIGFLPGKRESRRVVGEYILTENDLSSCHVFEDAVAYGGWPMDMHVIGGLRAKLEPTEYISVPDVYTIPYRSLYSKDVLNLFVGGRCISASHMAFGSTRVMGTCSVIGQAIGTAAALAIRKDIFPKDVLSYKEELQQTLLRQDAYIPGFKNSDYNDMALTAVVTASSEKPGYEAINAINGTSRSVHNETNCWHSDGFSKDGEWIELTLNNRVNPTSVEIKFDSNLSKQLMISMFKNGLEGQEDGIPRELVCDYSLQLFHEGELVEEIPVEENYLRLNKVTIPQLRFPINRVRIQVKSTHGCPEARIYEIRIY